MCTFELAFCALFFDKYAQTDSHNFMYKASQSQEI